MTGSGEGRGGGFESLLPSLPLRVWLLVSHALVLLLPAALMVGTGLLATELQGQTEADLRNQAALMSLFVERALSDVRRRQPDADLSSLGQALGPLLTRAKEGTLASFRLVDDRGVVVATSGDELGDDLSDRREVARALEGAQALSVRPRPPPSSAPLSSPSRRATVRLYLGHPIVYEGRTVGAVVLARTPREEVQALYQMVPWWAVVIPVGVMLLVALGVGQIATRSLTRLERVSRRIADGSFAAVVELDRPAQSRITEVRGLTSAFQHMADRLQARLAYISEFAGNVSHELKTPIATLRGTAELLRDDDEMPPEQRARFLDNAIQQLDRLERLLTGLLSLARAEQATARSPVDLDLLLQEAWAGVEGSAGVVQGNRDQLVSLVHNLLENARLHGGPTVRVRAWRAEGSCGFEVEDDGPGITPANLPRVFDRFFTTRRGAGGTGLGLALVRAIATSHGGEVTVSSEPGRTVFRVRLPAES